MTQSTLSQKGDASDTRIPNSEVSLESILCTEELVRRPSRPPDYEKENRALVALAQGLANSPRTILQTLADTILEVSQSGSAGISLLTTDDGGKKFYWPAIAGRWKPHIGGGTPRDFGPCGDVLDRNSPLLFRHVERRYTYFQPVTPPVEECLLVPFYVEGKAVGTIWAIAHDARRKFDAEDERLMSSLGKFASSAYQALASLDALQIQIAERTKAEAALRRSDTALRDFVETATIALHWVGSDGIVLWANQAELDLLGYTREEYIGHHIAEFHADQPAISDILARLIRGETLQEYEARLRGKDSSIRHVLINSSGMFEDGKFIHTRCFTRDITERKRAEAQLQENERHFREMIDALPAAIYTTDAEGRITHFNPAVVEFSGRAPDLGTDQWCVSWKMFWPDGTPLPHDECPMAVALKEGRIVDGTEAIAERPDGTRIWFTPYPRPFRDAEGRIVGGINMLVDITQRKQAERATGLLAAIVDSSDDAIISKSLNGVITSWNKSAERLFGYTSEEALGQHIALIVPRDRRHEETTIIERLKRGERVEHFETVRERKDGTTLDISLTISPVKDAAGRVLGASKVARDISERKQAERALRESEERFRMLADALENQVRYRTQELEQRNAEVLQQSEQLRDLSNRLLRSQDDERRHIARELHDEAGQMLTSLLVGLRTLEDARNLADVKVQGRRLREITAQAIDEVGRLARGLHPTVLDDHGLGVALSRYVGEYAKTHNIAVDLTLDELDSSNLPSAVQIGLYRILQEALTNVAKHSGAKAVSMRFARLATALEVAVIDDGCGFDAKAAAASSHRLGIRSMRERAAMLGGTVSFTSQGKGTKILLQLPLANQDCQPFVGGMNT